MVPEKTTEIGVKDWVRTTYDHWFERLEENPYQAAEQVLLQLDRLGRRNLSSMKDAASELKNVAGDEVFGHKVRDWLSPTTIKNSSQKRFLAVARHLLDKK
jgi:hypothetical protein